MSSCRGLANLADRDLQLELIHMLLHGQRHSSDRDSGGSQSSGGPSSGTSPGLRQQKGVYTLKHSLCLASFSHQLFSHPWTSNLDVCGPLRQLGTMQGSQLCLFVCDVPGVQFS